MDKNKPSIAFELDEPYVVNSRYTSLKRMDFDSNIVENWKEVICVHPPKRRCLHLNFIYKDYFYIYGGVDISDGKIADIKRICISDINSPEWKEVITTGVEPEALSGQGGVQVNDKFFVFGGENNRETPTNSLYILDLESLKWEKRIFSESDIPLLYGHSLNYYGKDNTIVVFGGFSKGIYRNSIYTYSIEKNTWTAHKIDSEEVPKGRISHGSVIARDSLIIYGGKNENNNLSDIWKFDLINRNWSQFSLTNSECPDARSGHSTVYYEKTDSIYIFGGKIGNLQEINELWKFDLKTESFELLHDTLLEQFGVIDTTKSNFMLRRHNSIKKTAKKSRTKSTLSSNNHKETLSTDPQTVQLKKTTMNSTLKSTKKQNQLSIFSSNVNFEEIVLQSPTSKQMKNSLIYKIDYTDASNIKLRVNTLLSQRIVNGDSIRIGTVPCPRDGHSALLYGEYMLVFGGDRNKFPFNDLHFLKI